MPTIEQSFHTSSQVIKPNTICKARHRNLAWYIQRIGDGWIQYLLQKQHNLLQFQFLLPILSLARMTLFFRNHKKTLIFKGNFVHQILCMTLIPLLTRTTWYWDFNVNVPILFKGHKVESLPTCILPFAIVQPICQSCNLFPTKALLKEIFSWHTQ
jgi:hypothetical protein